MGTIVSMTLYGEKEEAMQQIGKSLSEDVKTLEAEILSKKLSTAEVYKINENKDKSDGIEVSGQLANWVKESLAISKASDHSFDISLGNLTILWNIDSLAQGEADAKVPSENEIAAALQKSGSDKITLDGNTLCLKDDVRLDMGAVGKGVALDALKERLNAEEKLSGAVISLGGSILTYGQKPDESPWKVAIINPMDADTTIGYLEIVGEYCISTSGDYERFFECDGVRYHHILDPATGYPAENELRSVTIVSESGLISDALSTACFVLGKEKAMTLAQRCHAEILMVDREGNRIMSEGMKKIFHE